MPIVPLETFKLGDTATGVVEYQDSNMRISRFYWQDIPPGCVVTVVIWDTNSPSFPDPIFTGAFVGDGETPIAGNYQAVIETDPIDGTQYPAIPPNIIVQFSMVCPGG